MFYSREKLYRVYDNGFPEKCSYIRYVLITGIECSLNKLLSLSSTYLLIQNLKAAKGYLTLGKRLDFGCGRKCC